jgi:hypothetical protein
MDKLSDYIPLIIIIGSIVYSIVKRGNKTREEEISKTTLPGHAGGKEITGSEVFQTDSVRDIAKPVKKENKKKKTKTSSPKQTITQKALISSVFSNDSGEKESFVESGEPIINMENVDDVKKAIIYTEIFSRKEYLF